MKGLVWRDVFRTAVRSGSLASVTSALALLAGGARDLHNAITPLNGPSQWILGRCAPCVDGLRLPHTALGAGIHYGSSIFWALFFESTRSRPPTASRYADCVRPAALTAATAAFVDLVITPPRFRPGFEQRLSASSLVGVYAAFALGLAAARLAERRIKPPDSVRAAP
ncbi:MAG: hypothetical protein IT493_10695 [Gammaproteobacteria bacterium]|jgi:hypothetical protein|nr:hypothetical protein [Gammaproteobacteria bacterium]